MTKQIQAIKQITHTLLAIFLILIGFGLVYASSNDFIQLNTLVNDQKHEFHREVKADKIYIPSMDSVLDITDGFVANNRWTVSESGVSHLTTSPIPGNVGNVVLYGHNRQGILNQLWRVQEGDFVYITLSNGEIAKYRIFERKEVEPNGVEILEDVGGRRLTLYTCSGFLDSARYVIVGELVS